MQRTMGRAIAARVPPVESQAEEPLSQAGRDLGPAPKGKSEDWTPLAGLRMAHFNLSGWPGVCQADLTPVKL